MFKWCDFKEVVRQKPICERLGTKMVHPEQILVRLMSKVVRLDRYCVRLAKTYP